MSLYATPKITPERGRKLDAIDSLRAELGARLVPSERWVQALRRTSRAIAYASSTRIEGFSTSPARALELLDDSAPVGDDELAFSAYALAMQHVGAMAADSGFRWSRRAILDLHFDVCSFQPDARPGLVREGPIFVTGPSGSMAFEGPPAGELNGLLEEFIDWIGAAKSHPLVTAAMAHLNLVSIHPFEDGNGRTSRVVQSLAIALSGETAPEFGSIEEYLAAHTTDYYAALASAQHGKFDPDRPADEWLDFCLDAHWAQIKDRLELIGASADRWHRLELLVEERGWPDRIVIALEQALSGRLTRSAYAQEADIAVPTASLDLRRLVDAGLLDVAGGGRSTHYVPAPPLRRTV